MRSRVPPSVLDLPDLPHDGVRGLPHRLAVSADHLAVVVVGVGVRAHEGLPEQMEVDAARLRAVVPATQAEVDHHDPTAADDPRTMETPRDTADRPRDSPGRRPSAVERLFPRRTLDELHHDLVLDRVDVVEDRDRYAGGTRVRHETRLRPEAGPPQILVQGLESVSLRGAVLLDRGPAEELGPSQLGLRAALHQHGRAMRTRRQKPSGLHAGFGVCRRNPVTSDAGESLRTGEKSGGRHRAYRGSSSRPSSRTIAARSVSLRIGRPAAWRTLFTAGNTYA